MRSTTRTTASQKFWDAAFLQAHVECLRELLKSGKGLSVPCAHIARDQADAALEERRRSAAGEPSR